MTKKPKHDELAEAKRIAARMLAMPPDPHKGKPLPKQVAKKPERSPLVTGRGLRNK